MASTGWVGNFVERFIESRPRFSPSSSHKLLWYRCPRSQKERENERTWDRKRIVLPSLLPSMMKLRIEQKEKHTFSQYGQGTAVCPRYISTSSSCSSRTCSIMSPTSIWSWQLTQQSVEEFDSRRVRSYIGQPTTVSLVAPGPPSMKAALSICCSRVW